MRLKQARVAPVTPDTWSAEQQQVLEPFHTQGQLYNVIATIGNNPEALRAFLAWGSYVLRRTALEPREREIIILRVGHLCRSDYEWAQHVRLARSVGMTTEEIAAIRVGAGADLWDARARTLLTATDELQREHFVSDSTWGALTAFMSPRQCMDVVFIAGHYVQVCMMLNTFGVQLDPGLVSGSDH